MLRNYFKSAWRNLWKNKVYSAINIGGLAIGMAACVIIMLFVFYEQSFDRFHTKNIYRLNEVQKFPGMVSSQKVALSMFPMGPTLKQEFPQVRNFTRIRWDNHFQMTYGDKRIFLPQALIVDTSFLQMFDFRLLKGNRVTAMQKPNSIILTASAAQKLFGNEDPVGKTISHYSDDTALFTITGIAADVPENSQLQFDALYSFSTIINPKMSENWGGNWLNTYLELSTNTDVASMEEKFPAYLKKHMSGSDNWRYYELFLLPLKDVHSHASDIGLDYINFQKFDSTYTNIFLVIALIVLLIACINFINLSTARSAERAREVGIRKSIGALRSQLTAQFLGETVLLSLVALFLALGLVLLVLPYVNNLSQRHLQSVLSQNTWIFVAVPAGTLLIGILSGLYPSAYLSSFQPVKVLKGLPQIGNSKGMLRNILVVGQFTSAIFLMIATIFVYRQLSFMQHKDPGFDREQVLTISLDGVTSQKYDFLKEELSASSFISGVTGARDQLGSHLDQAGVVFRGNGPVTHLTTTLHIVDPDYLRVYKIPVIYGKDFSREKSAEGKEYIINETLARELLKDNPHKPMASLIGMYFGFDTAGMIVGIAKDFNFNSLHYKIESMFLANQKNAGMGILSIKINGGKTDAAIAFIGAAWKKIFPDRPFEYQFLDDHFAEIYRVDTQVKQMVGILAALAIFISCLGLFGLASYSAEKRIKEIGIRKVMGASIQNIVVLLSRNFIRLVLISNLIAWPLALYAISHWLQGYAYHVAISWWVFLLAGMIALAIALLTVSILAMRAAMANPVTSLRSE